MDRRILAISGVDEQEKQKIQKLTDIAIYPHVVLLGEPGIGKSTALKFMADLEACKVMNVRAFIHNAKRDPAKPLFLDALDEYRSDENRSNDTYSLADLIAKRSPTKWRLTCRAEDWRRQSDADSFVDMGAAENIVVVQLLPLNYPEACCVLSNLGEENPEEFMGKAKAIGADAFTKNPLSLKLLREAVSSHGQWPSTRFELFSNAISKLSNEHNQVYREDYQRISRKGIIEATGKIALLQLLSGAGAIWRSKAPPPDNADQLAYITMDDLELEGKLLADSLDTPLFRGEGESFEFMHRTIAEFLAGQALAKAVTAKGSQARFPLRRALALLIGSNGKSPTELRGLFAWFAAHLAKEGDHSGAKRMAEIDACSVLFYGDAAVFDVETRKAILHNLDRDDPYFRAAEQGVTVLGGLLDEALTDDIIRILKDPPPESHLLLTVADSLASGKPIPTLQPILKEFILDSSRAAWQRKQILVAYIHGSTDKTFELKQLYDELTEQTATLAREELRIDLACKLYPEQFTVADLQKLLNDFENLPEDNTAGRLFWLEKALAQNSCSALFEMPSTTWRQFRSSTNRAEVDHLLDEALAACILSEQDLTGQKLWHWVVNSREYFSDKNGYEKASGAAICTWLEAHQDRELELFEAILASSSKNPIFHDAERIFIELCVRWPSESTLQSLWVKVKSGDAEHIAPGLLAIYVQKARHVDSDPALFWEIYELLKHYPEQNNLHIRLTTSSTEYGKPEELRNQARIAEQQLKQVLKIERLTALIPELKKGNYVRILWDNAASYFQPVDFRRLQPIGMARVIADTNQEIAKAISEGWKSWATEGILEFEIPMLSSIVINEAEYVALAGLARMIETETESEIPASAIQPLILAFFRRSTIIRDSSARKIIEVWIVNQLVDLGVQGSDLLVDLWSTYIAASVSPLPGLNDLSRQPAAATVLSVALSRLVTEQDSLSIDYLRSLLIYANKVLSKERIEKLCSNALHKETIPADVRQLWELRQFVNSPCTYLPPTIESIDAKKVNDLLHFMSYLTRPENNEPPESHLRIACFIIELAGPFTSPDSKEDFDFYSTLLSAINRLASFPKDEATKMLKKLIENPKLKAWHSRLRNALSLQSRLRFDQEFKHPSIESICDALAGGPPVNAADLFAIAVEVLRRLQSELRTSDITPWKNYWSRDSNANVTDPLIENECRNYLLDKLRDRLSPYHICIAVPEAQSVDNTRVDILLRNDKAANVPIEAKRHFHPDVWSAAETQLQNYATAQGADGYGIYLVFWFGCKYKPTPPLPDKTKKPETAKEMEKMLQDRLPEMMRMQTEIIVFDVSPPSKV